MLSSGKKLLIADDAQTVHTVFHEALSRFDAPITLVDVYDGAGAFEALSRGDIDLAFIDVQMPSMSGIDALSCARIGGIDTFTTLMSSPGSGQFIEAARKLKAYDFLFKPFRVSDIEAIVKAYLQMSAPLRALVVDDSATMRNVIQKVMAKSQFNLMLDAVNNGERALAYCQAHHMDIVFLDLNMPGLNGLETMAQLLDQSPMLKVVMVSGSANAADERMALKFGAAAFLRKPFYPHHVDRLLREIYHLRSPKTLTVRTAAPTFDVAISGRRVAVVHKSNGHVFEYLWFRDSPHLRNCQVRENRSGIGSAAEIREQAHIAALAELRAAALVMEAA